jgi:hypothetical protein
MSARLIVPRVRTTRLRVTLYVLLAAAWGAIVDGNFIPLLAPTSNSTIFQASTAAAFAAIGILFGPVAGGMGGLVRDGSGHVLTLLLHPGLPALEALGRAVPDILEDVVLGLIPGLAGLYTRRLLVLLAATYAAAWISLPLFLEVGNALVAARPDTIPALLTTAPGDWNEPVDPGLTVYALLAAGMAGVAVTRRSSDRRIAYLAAGALTAGGCVLIALGAHS